MDKFKPYSNLSSRYILYLVLLFIALTGCKQSGRPGAATGQPDEEVREKERGYVIILGGGRNLEDAEASMYRFRNHTYPFELAEDYPAIFISDSIEGLNPGFRICVLGFCEDQAAAEKLRDLVNVTAEEVAYIKKVNHYMGYVDCPKIPFNQQDFSAYDQLFSGPVKDKVSSVRWSLYSQSEYFEVIDCEVVSYTLVVKQGKNLLDVEIFDEICYDPAMMEEEFPEEYEEYEEYEEGEEGYEGEPDEYPEGEMEDYGIEGDYPEDGYYQDLGERLTFEIEKFRLADRTFILVKSAHAAYDEIAYEDKLYGFVNGEIKKVATVFTGAEYTSPRVTYEFIPDFSPDDWTTFAILETVQFEHTSETVFEWNNDILEFEITDSGIDIQ